MKAVREKPGTALGIVTVLIPSLYLATSALYATDFNGGSGTPTDPYQIATTDQLIAVVNDPNASYVLVSDIDLSDRVFSAAVIEEFSGSFNGGGNQISNLSVQGGDSLGLFGYLRDSAEVQG